MPRAAAALVLVLALAGCGGSTHAATTARTSTGPVATTPRSTPRGPDLTHFLGATAGDKLSASPAVTAHEVALMGRTGVTSLRTAFYWSLGEPAKGTFSFAATDLVMTAAAKSRLDVLPVLLGTPEWAASEAGKAGASPPRHPADYAAFVTAVVKRYGPGGTFWKDHPSLPADPVRAWQIWNEPSHLAYWTTQPFAKSFVPLARAGSRAVRAADPKALVVSPGFPDRSWESIAQLEKAGGKGLWDVIAVHPYTFVPDNVLRIVELVRDALRHGGEARIPIWATEVTWSSGQGKVAHALGFETTEKDQARKLAAVFPLLARNSRRLRLQRAYWESWITGDSDRQNTFDYSGLRELRPDGTVRAKPAFGAFARIGRRFRHSG